MNYFNGVSMADQLLKHYKGLERSVQNLDQRINSLVRRASPRPLKAIDIEEMIKAGGKKDTTLNLLFEIKVLMDTRDETKEELSRIDKVLEDIEKEPGCKFYTPVLRAWYIDKTPKEDIAKEIGYSSRQSIYDIKNAALRKFAVELFGIKSLIDR